MKKSKIKKIFIIAICFLSLAFFGLSIFIINKLPSAKEISSKFRSSSSKSVKPSISGEGKITQQQNTAAENPVNPNLSQATPEMANEKIMREKMDKTEASIKELMQEDAKDIRVCDNLGRSKMIVDKKEVDFSTIFDNEQRTDSYGEALRIPIKAIFQEEHMHNLFQEIFQYKDMNMGPDERTGFLEKAGFYSKLAWTVGQLYQKKAEFEKLGDRAVHLSVLAQIAAVKPELARDSQIQDFCRQLEASIADQQTVNILDERKEILKMIQYAGMTPEQLKFDPNNFIKFGIQSSKDGISFSLDDGQKNQNR